MAAPDPRSKVPPGSTLKQTRAELAKESAKYGEAFVDMPISDRAKANGTLRALRNRHFLVQVYAIESAAAKVAPGLMCRLSVSRCLLNDRGDWLDGITWDQLQVIKDRVGFGQHDALEVYPANKDLVDVANIRHLWILREPLPWAWGKFR